MISEIVHKEKVIQDECISKANEFKGYQGAISALGKHIESHKQSLINLKENMEREIALVDKVSNTEGADINAIYRREAQLKKDIAELNIMIEKYE